MKFVVDTCGWIEWLIEGKLSQKFHPFLEQSRKLIVPTIIQLELYKWICREKDEATALNIIGITEQCNVKPLDTPTALFAAEVSTYYQLSMADAIIYAHAQKYQAELITSDKHFENLPHVKYFSKQY